MNRRGFLGSVLGFFLANSFLGRIVARAQGSPITRIAFGSCFNQGIPHTSIWPAIRSAKPQLFIFLGDNIYADTEDMAKMKKDYETLGAIPSFAAMRSEVPVIATWDDHDYGQNDGGADYKMKKQAKELMLDFFQEPAGSERRAREGVYTSYFYGEAPNRLQVILLDLRTFRGKLKQRTTENWGYQPNLDPQAELLGHAQWVWLEDQLRQPADLRILGSSVQMVSQEHEWEKWGNFPHEKERLYTLIDRLRLRNILVISGDMHFAELSSEKTPSGTEIHDLTASGLNVVEKVPGIPNSKRHFFKDDFAHFGFLQIKWGHEIKVRLEVRDDQNKTAFGKTIKFSRGELLGEAKKAF